MIIHVIGTASNGQLASLRALAKANGFELQHMGSGSDDSAPPQLWETDALILVDWAKNLDTRDTMLIRWVELLKHCGRPKLHLEMGEVCDMEQFLALSLKPRTNYQPVDCGYYDHFEAAIVKRKTQRIRLTCFGESGEDQPVQELGLLGTKTWRKEEFVEVEGYGWLRADWVKMVDVSETGDCSI